MGVVVPFLILFLILYAYLNHYTGFTTTVTALRHFWSDECRMSCLQSDSGFSGMSGLNRPPTTGACVCDSCPCLVVEEVIRSCEPATTLYTQIVETVGEYYYQSVLATTNLLEYVTTVLRGDTHSDRQKQMMLGATSNTEAGISSYGRTDKDVLKLNASNTLKPATCLTFDKLPAQELDASASKDLKTKKSSDGSAKKIKDALRRTFSKSKQDIIGAVESVKSIASSKLSINKNKGKSPSSKEAVVIPVNLEGFKEMTRDSSGTLADSAICSRCIEKGNVCVKECPSAKKKK